MHKQQYWLLLALFALFLAGALFVFGYAPQSHRISQHNPDLRVEHGAQQEPISPIPFEVKLDARKVELGRRLFHDPQLSRDGAISCAHCHNLATAGVDRLPRPAGIGGRQGEINVPTVFNAGFNFRQFWNGRAATLEDVVDSHLQNTSEMGAAWPDVIARLENDAGYRRAFAPVYQEGIQPSAVKDALAAFVRSLTTSNSKFDRYLRGEKSALDRDELAGYDLFKSYGCITCHQGVNVGGNMYGKLGLIEDYFRQRGSVQIVDYGRYNLTRDENDRYRFRVPSLRNIALTAPYFHDASARTLEAAVVIMGKYELGVDLRDDEVVKIVKFLETLTGTYQGGTGK